MGRVSVWTPHWNTDTARTAPHSTRHSAGSYTSSQHITHCTQASQATGVRSGRGPRTATAQGYGQGPDVCAGLRRHMRFSEEARLPPAEMRGGRAGRTTHGARTAEHVVDPIPSVGLLPLPSTSQILNPLQACRSQCTQHLRLRQVRNCVPQQSGPVQRPAKNRPRRTYQ